jgi:hypothetical protein
MTFPKISLEVIEATAAVAQRETMNGYAMSSVLNLMESQPALTNLVNSMCGNLIAAYDDAENGKTEFAQNAMLVAAYAAYGLAMDSVKAQIEADEFNKEWA